MKELPIGKPDIENLPFSEEELIIALEKGSVHDSSLDPEHIEMVASDIYSKNGFIAQNQHEELISSNYNGFDLIKHGFHHFIGDLKLLSEFFREAISTVQGTILPQSRTGRVGMIGCGPGRLAIPTIELAKKLSIEELIFNDLLPDHVEQTRERISSAYGTRSNKIDGVKISYIEGDFLKKSKSVKKKFDVLFAMWFVTSEIADFSSTEKLRLKRKELYQSISDALNKKGIFVEDIPYSEGVGAFYYLVRLKTYDALNKLGVLKGENHNIIITDYRQNKSIKGTDHIRYAPANGEHYKELETAGFESNFFRITTQTNGFKNLAAYEKEFGNYSRIQKLFSGNDLDAIIRYLSQKESSLLNPPHSSDPMAKKKKTVMWRKQH